MKVNYDKVADVIYIEMKSGKVKSTIEASPFVLHDLDSNGDIIGIEILNASSQLSANDLENNVENGIPLNIISATPKTV